MRLTYLKYYQVPSESNINCNHTFLLNEKSIRDFGTYILWTMLIQRNDKRWLIFFSGSVITAHKKKSPHRKLPTEKASQK